MYIFFVVGIRDGQTVTDQIRAASAREASEQLTFDRVLTCARMAGGAL